MTNGEMFSKDEELTYRPYQIRSFSDTMKVDSFCSLRLLCSCVNDNIANNRYD